MELLFQAGVPFADLSVLYLEYQIFKRAEAWNDDYKNSLREAIDTNIGCVCGYPRRISSDSEIGWVAFDVINDR